tara:strand:+ start:5169 stop:5534 length:366 start_codon:yes stop_codon:yes gene_type:complete
MTVTADSEKEYIRKYLLALQGLMGFSPRELDVAVLMVYRYKMLVRLQSKLKNKKAKEDFDPFQELKMPEVLGAITKELNMSFGVFKNYIRGLKAKGFFDVGSINSICVPEDGQTTITFKHV